ncbi:MAG: TonB-dependent receptor [Pseudomonadota bacterium]
MLVWLVCNFTISVQAEELDEIVVQAYRLSPKLDNTPANVTVINRRDIEKHAARNVAELLTNYGLHVEQSAGPGSLSSIFLRGADPNFTLVLINGTKVNDPTNSRGGSFDFSSLDAVTIERIEVVRGPLSSTYGSDALSGVINIITREPTAKTHASANLVKGENGLNAVSSTYAQQFDHFDFSITGSYNDSGEQVSNTELVSRSGDMKGAWQHSDATSIHWHARYYDSSARAFPEDSGGTSFAVLQDVEKRDVFESLANIELRHHLNERAALSFKSAVFHHEEDTDSPGVAPGIRDPFGIPVNRSDSEFTRYAFTASGTFQPWQHVMSVVGVDVEIEDGETKGFLDFGGGLVPTDFDLKRTTQSVFSELEAFIGPLTFQSGIRLDNPEDFSNRLSPNVGVNYNLPNTETNFRLSWGKGFKLPSFFALGNPIVGNPNIKPETSETLEAGVITNIFNEKGQVNLTLFTQKFEDIVDFDAGPPPSLVNRNNVTAKGLELAISFNPIKNITSNTYINYVDTNIKDSQDELLNRPEWRGSFSLNWQAKENLSYNLQAIYVDDVLDSTIPTGEQKLDDYTRVDVSATWSVFTNLDAILAVDNLFDKDYEESIGNTAPGIAARLQIHGIF